jgi:hypothetical protein
VRNDRRKSDEQSTARAGQLHSLVSGGRLMADELIADLPYRVIDANGVEYYAGVAAEQRADGQWEAWLEYVPVDDTDALLTHTETTQPTHADVVRWADTLSETYVQGAFVRAVAATSDSRLVSRRVDLAVAAADIPTAELPDPFELFALGKTEMRLRLRTLPRSTLLAMIAAFGLNPPGTSLSWLTQQQLVVFIVTAVEVQSARGRRTP